MTKQNKTVLAIMVLIGFAIMYFSLRKVPLRSLIGDLNKLEWQWLLIALISILCSFFVEAIIGKVLLHQETMNFPWLDAIRVPLIGQLFNGITPFSTGSQPAQLFALVQSGVDAGRATSVLLMKFIVYQSMVVINFIFALLIGFHYIADKMHALSLFFIFGFVIHFCVIVGLLMIMYWYSFTRKLVKMVFKPAKWFISAQKVERWEKIIDEKIANFYDESLRLRNDGKLLLKIVCLTLLQLTFYYLVPYFIILALGEKNISLLLVVTFHILIVMVISLFPIPGGSGGAEYSFSIIFSSFITNSSKLVLAMLLWRLLTYYLAMFLGLIAMLIYPKRIDKKD
jgi:uncharacterized protein (TIRG00374 family)